MAAVKTGSAKGSTKTSPKDSKPSKPAPAKKTPSKYPPSSSTNASPKKSNGCGVYQLKVSLTASEPLVWRRILVPGTMSLAELHRVLQAVMGWGNSHMHLFRSGKQIFADARQVDEDAGDEAKMTLAELAPIVKSRFEYVYDFGDDWHHEILVEQVGPEASGVDLPTCLGGENACPPEDCGGIPGYLDMLEVLKDPDHEEYEDTQEWIGETFDPFKFDLKKANARLKGG